MKNSTMILTILCIITITSLFLAGCEPGPVMTECSPPLMLHGSTCCLDADRNGICDTEEAEQAIDKTKTDEEQATKETSEQQQMQKEAEETEKPDSKAENPAENPEKAEEIGKLFAERWETKQYNTMYILFTPALKDMKTATEFTAIMELDPFYKKIEKVDFKGVEMLDDDTAELRITYHTNVQDIELKPATLELVNGKWGVNAFADVFSIDLYDAACSGYRQNKQYKMSDCAFDLAKKVNDEQYCEKSECHYTECLRAVGSPTGVKQEAKQCFYCQPVMKTINDCILDVAIKYDKISACDVISDDHYSDKYCACYGRFAKHKETPGYCNTITNPDYKALCMKGFEGKYC